MITKWMLTGDTHGQFDRFRNLPEDEEIGMIVLGDFSIDFYMNSSDNKNKNKFIKNYPNLHIYAVRGNHEMRPADISGIEIIYDEDVGGMVYCHPKWTNIRYLMDGGEYCINGYSVLAIGGAYSVDKHWRIANGHTWFPNEQLTKEEMNKIANKVCGKHYDFIFSHTCPYDWRPTDKFLSMIDQNTVDSSMELWLMNDIKNKVSFEVWCWGHYHDNRIERPHAEMHFQDMEELNAVYDRWEHYSSTGELDWWLTKSPNFYMQ